jgi:tetratricopeptide (TPR) repeat protein
MNYLIFDQDELFALSQVDMKNQNYERALEKIKIIMSRENIPIETLALAGKLYASIGLFEKARDAFFNFTQQVPNAYLELFQLGMVERDMGNISLATTIWEKVLEIEPNYPEALYYLADACVQLDLIDNARDWLFKLLETAPDNSEYIQLADQLLYRIKAH